MWRRKAREGGRFQNKPERSQRFLPNPSLGSKAVGHQLRWPRSAKAGGQAGSTLKHRGGRTGVTRGPQVGAAELGAGAGRREAALRRGQVHRAGGAGSARPVLEAADSPA